jgi:transposase
MRGVFVDIETGHLLEMTETNKKDVIVSTIESMVGYDKNIEIVTMDMSAGYRAHVQECLPCAKIIVDKYHVYQDLYAKISKTKTRIIEFLNWKISKMEKPDAKQYKDILSLASKNPYLFKFGPDKLMGKPERIAAMAEVCSTFPEFNHLRLLKEGFERIYACDTRAEAERIADEWGELVPPKGSKQVTAWQGRYNVPPELYCEFRTLKNTVLKNWRNEIFTYFEPGCRVTNAATEGLNNMIERANRLGNGYSFARLRAKALYWHLAAPKTRYTIEVKKKPVYKEEFTMCFAKYGTGHQMPPRTLVGYEDYHSIEEKEGRVVRDPLSLFSYLPKGYEPI